MAFLEKSTRKCNECGEVLGRFWGDDICPKCKESKNEAILAIENQRKTEELDKYEEECKKAKSICKNIILSTTPSLEGYKISEYLGIESSEVIIGTGVVTDFISSITDLVGGRASGYENSLSKAKQEAFDILRFKGSLLGGNAIVGVKSSYMDIGDNMFGVFIEGTIVKVDLINDEI